MVKIKQNINVIDDLGIDDKEETTDNNNIIKDANGDNTMDELDSKKLEELKARLAKSELPEKSVSLKFGILGLGHAGSRIAEEFYKLGYAAVAVNTATQDLVHIDIPNKNKLFMDCGIQGAAKDLNRGFEAAVQYKTQLQELVYDELDACQVIIIASSAGGGSGAGSLTTAIDICNTTGKPIVLMTILPMSSEDAKCKSNSLETIAKLTAIVSEGHCQGLILIDNAKIEMINAGVGQMQFYKVANQAIVEPIDVFNFYSMQPSEFKALDSAEWATILLNSGGISTYGEITIEDYEGELAISQAIIDSLQKNMLVSGLDFKTTKYVGYLMLANKNVWAKVATGATNYANAMINDIFGSPEATYKGMYQTNEKEDVIKIYTFVSGLGLPNERIETLKKEIGEQQINLKAKDVERGQKLKIDLSKDSTTTEAERIKAKISAKLSGFGKLNNLGRK